MKHSFIKSGDAKKITLFYNILFTITNNIEIQIPRIYGVLEIVPVAANNPQTVAL